jgi:hypothetical protein
VGLPSPSENVDAFDHKFIGGSGARTALQGADSGSRHFADDSHWDRCGDRMPRRSLDRWGGHSRGDRGPTDGLYSWNRLPLSDWGSHAPVTDDFGRGPVTRSIGLSLLRITMPEPLLPPLPHLLLPCSRQLPYKFVSVSYGPLCIRCSLISKRKDRLRAVFNPLRMRRSVRCHRRLPSILPARKQENRSKAASQKWQCRWERRRRIIAGLEVGKLKCVIL